MQTDYSKTASRCPAKATSGIRLAVIQRRFLTVACPSKGQVCEAASASMDRDLGDLPVVVTVIQTCKVLAR